MAPKRKPVIYTLPKKKKIRVEEKGDEGREVKVQEVDDVPRIDVPGDESEDDEEESREPEVAPVGLPASAGKHPANWFEKARVGFEKEDYPAKRQKRDYNYHITKKAAGGAGKKARNKQVPPIHTGWDTSVFNKGGDDLMKFLTALSKSKRNLESLRYEVDFEHNVLFDDDSKGFPNFHTSQMQWMGWSGMLELEKRFKEEMDDCDGFPQCLGVLWENRINGDFTGFTWEEARKWALEVMNVLHLIWEHIWQDVRVYRVSSVSTFIEKRILGQLHDSKFFSHFFPDRVGELQAYDKLRKETILKVPLDVVDKQKQLARGRVTKALKRPDVLHESWIAEGVRRLTWEIWPNGEISLDAIDDFDNENVHLDGLSKRMKAISCLLQIMCGSRLFGILMVNFFNEVSTGTMADWKADRNGVSNGRYESLESIGALFGQSQHCIVVTRPSKEDSAAKKVVKKLRTKLPGESDPTLEEMKEMVIVKPINFMFVDSKWLNKENYSQDGNTGVQIFLRLVAYLRENLGAAMIDKGVDVEEQDNVLGLSQALVEKTPKVVRNLMSSWTKSINVYVRSIFTVDNAGTTMFKPRQGTHLLRKIYTIWAYQAFASTTMKETGFASAVLGHKGFAVSLNYTSLIITPSLSNRLTAVGQLNLAMAAIRRRLATLERGQLDVPDQSQANFYVDGEVVSVSKIALPHNSSSEVRNAASLDKLEEMKALGIPLSLANQRLVKIQQDNTKKKELRAMERYKEVMK